MTRYKIGVSIANDSRESIRANRVADRRATKAPSTAGNSMTGSERPSPKPLLKKFFQGKTKGQQLKGKIVS